jgi:hypothetical protein
MKAPKAFISYSWDDGEHREWVRRFASRLRHEGVDVTLDQWHAAPGDQLPAFMERAIRENDFVLIICTPKYKAKSDDRHGGVGYEGDVIHGEVFVTGNHRKFIPILRIGEWSSSAPSALLGKYYIDLRDKPEYETNYRDLLLTLHGKRDEAPIIGNINLPIQAESTFSESPSVNIKTRDLPKPRHYTFISDKKVDVMFPQIPTDYIHSFKHSSEKTNPYFKVGIVSQYINEFYEVGTIDDPKEYFSGTIKARCLVTVGEVFFGSMIEVVKGEKKFKYVGLSGSLQHMKDYVFRELRNKPDYIDSDSWFRSKLWGRNAEADFVPLTSSTAGFHSYLRQISSAEWEKEQESKKLAEQKTEKLNLTELLSDSQHKESASNESKTIKEKYREHWKEVFLGLLLSGLPLSLSVLGRHWIGRWAFVLIALSILWALLVIAILHWYVTFKLNLKMDLSVLFEGPTLECSVRNVTMTLRASEEDYEFLAKTITVGECKGEMVVLGSPVYIALK